MGLFYSEVRKPFRFAPPVAWALAIDIFDVFSTPILAFATGVAALGGVTAFPVWLGGGAFLTTIETAAALIVFEDWSFAVSNPDYVLPAPLNLFPSYTAKIVAHKMGWVG